MTGNKKKAVDWIGNSLERHIYQLNEWIDSIGGSRNSNVRVVRVFTPNGEAVFSPGTIDNYTLLWCEYVCRCGVRKSFRNVLRDAQSFWGDQWSQADGNAFLRAMRVATGITINLARQY